MLLKTTLKAIVIFALLTSFTAESAQLPEKSPQNPDSRAIKVIAGLIDEGTRQYKSGAFAAAAELFIAALRSAEAARLPRYQIRCVQALGDLRWDLGRIDESSDLFEQGLTLARNLNDNNIAQYCLAAKAIIGFYSDGKELRAQGRYQDSIARFNRALQVASTLNSDGFKLKCLRQQSLTYWQMNDFFSFLECNRRALALAEKLLHKIEKGRCLNNIGLYYERCGEYSRALIYFEEAKEILDIQGDSDSKAECLNNIGLVYKEVGDLESAIANFNDALILDKKSGNASSTLKDLINLSSVTILVGIQAREKEHFSKSLSILKECLSLVGNYGDDNVRIAILNNIGIAYYGLGEYARAISFYLSALENNAVRLYPEERLQILNNMADAYFKGNKMGEAAAVLRTAASIAQNLEVSPVTWATYFEMGLSSEGNEELEKALFYFRKSIDIVEKTREKIEFDPFKIGFVRNKLAIYHHAISVLLRMYEKSRTGALLDEMFEIIEKAKARAFLETLLAAKIDPARPKMAPQQLQSPRASKAVTYEPNSPAGIGDLSVSGLAAKSACGAKGDVGKATDLTLDADRPGVVSYAACSITQTQNTLINGRSAILQYWLGDEKSVLLLITKKRTRIFELGARARIESSLRAFIRLLRVPDEKSFTGKLAAERIAKELLPPPDDDIWDQLDYLIIVPDGVLHYLPFEALIIGTKTGKQFLVERYKVSYCPSVSSLAYLQSQENLSKARKELLAFGSPNYRDWKFLPKDVNSTSALIEQSYVREGFKFTPLPYSEKEVSDIAKHFPPSLTGVFLKDRANEAEFKRICSNDYRIMHFACHSFLDERFPLRSALVLAPNLASDDDGFVQANEICNLRLNADLVVLSACQTAGSVLENMEGLMGLPRFFFYAGTRAVLSSLWSVSDQASSGLMVDFYRFLLGGLDKTSALQAAKIKLIRSAKSHPFYWAAFILSGNISPIFPSCRLN